MNEAEDRKRFTIDGREPYQVVFPESAEQIVAALRSAAEKQLSVIPIGNGTFLQIGNPPRRYDLALSVQHLNRVVDYQPTDMTVTVEAGMTVTQLQEVLGKNGQWLPIDPPLPDRTTVGGLIAANLSGPSRFSQGTIRDFLIGLKAVQANGAVVKGGGQVVKNVAGYDLPKLYCGSFGTLGVIIEATFKVRPRPQAQTVLSLPFPSVEKAMEVVLQLLGTELQPFFLESTNVDFLGGKGNTLSPYWLFVGLAGIVEEISYQDTRFREVVGDSETEVQEWKQERAQALLIGLRDFPATGEATLRYRASVLPTQTAVFCKTIEEEAKVRGFSTKLLVRTGNGIIYGRLPRLENAAQEQLLSFVDRFRILAKELDGYGVIEGIDPALKDRVDVWGYVGSAFPLMKRLKETLDPQGILTPGRFVGGI
jgi:glycolate oxidase FAD binding subunit